MKTLALATAVLLTATAASAADLGWGFTGGADVDANYTTGVNAFALDVTPNVGYTVWGADLQVSTTLDLSNINSIDFTGLDYSVEYPVGSLTAYGEISSDADFDFGDATVGMRFSF